MSERIISESLERELIATFGDEAAAVVERLLRPEITRHRIQQALSGAGDPAALVAEALSRDPGFLGKL